MIGRLTLGTAGFGQSYGIRPMGRPATKPSAASVDALLTEACAGGITWLDTAAAYGDAEEQIGRCRAAHRLQVSTKILPNSCDDTLPAQMRGHLRRLLEPSLRRLRRSTVDVLLLHSARYTYRPDILDALLQLTILGDALRVGISCYEPDEARAAMAAGATAIQAPYSLFDRRFEAVFDEAARRDVLVFARQPFVQGLLLMRPEEIPDSLAATRPLVQAFRGACRGADLAPAEAALRYVARRYAISQIVFGVEDHDQLWFDLRVAMRAARLPSAIDWAPFEAIASVADALGSVVHPSRWARPEVPA